jgi:hypothetical protein
MRLENSKNLKVFKKEIGQVNHFLITILVGLDGVKNGTSIKNDEFSTSWNPRNIRVSADRSSDFAKKSTLTWVVENLEMYLRMCNEEPKILTDSNIQRQFDSFGRSVYLKAMAISRYLGIGEINQAMVDLTICWRNKLVHYNAENRIEQKSYEVLLREKENISKAHNGLNIERVIDSYEKKRVPSFKEITSMVRASIDFITEIDQKLIDQLDILNYSDRLIYNYISTNLVSRLNNIYSKDDDTKRRVLRNIFKDYGFSEEEDDDVDGFIEKLAELNYALAKRKLIGGSFR